MSDPNPAPAPTKAAQAKKATKGVAIGTMGGGGLAVTISWLWSIFVPDHPMPTEVAMFIGPFLAAIIGRFI
jgi:hypothetical protein